MEKLVEFLLYLQGPIPYIVCFLVLLACGLGVPIPEDLTLFAMGLLSYYGLTDLTTSIIVCFVGVMFGDSVIFLIGKHYGVALANRGIFKKLFHPERFDKIKEMYGKYGNKLIFAARFMPGFRAATYFSAGAFKLSFWVFFFYDGLAALLSVPLLVGVIYYFGDQLDKVIKIVHDVQYAIIIAIVIAVIYYIVKHFRNKKSESGSN